MKAVLTYHSVDDSGSVISVTRAQLAKQLDDVLASGAAIVPFEEIYGLPKDVNAVAITFDDGFANFSESAMPVLRERKIPATVFVVAKYVGSSNDWEGEDSRANVPHLPLMTWSDLRALGPDIRIGAHGFTHKSLKGLRPSSRETELSHCTSMMEGELGSSPATFAFPYGDFDEEAVSAAKRHFKFACTTEFALLTGDSSPHAIPRLDSFYFRDTARLRRFGSREFAAWVQVRSVARRARRTLMKPRADG